MNKRNAWLLLLLFLLAACSATAPVPEDRFFRLEPQAAAGAVEKPVISGVLRVDPVAADPLRSGRAILFRDSARPLELHRYHYEFWVEQPPKMLHQALYRYLASSGIAGAVQLDAQRRRADYRIQSRLLRFERVTGSGQPVAEIGLEVSLLSESSGKTVWRKEYVESQESNAGDMHATARAMQRALGRLFAELLTDLARLGPDP